MKVGWNNNILAEILKPFFEKLEELICEDGERLWGSKTVISSKLRLTVLQTWEILRMKELAELVGPARLIKTNPENPSFAARNIQVSFEKEST